MVNQIGLYDEVAGSCLLLTNSGLIGCPSYLSFAGFGDISVVASHFLNPLIKSGDIALSRVEPSEYLTEFHLLLRKYQNDMYDILLLDNMIEFPILLIPHPHTALALIQCQMTDPIEEHRHFLRTDLSLHLHVLSPLLLHALVLPLHLVNREFLIIIVQVLQPTYQSLLRQLQAQFRLNLLAQIVYTRIRSCF